MALMFGLIQNIALLVALSVAQQLIMRHKDGRSVTHSVISGILYGAVAITAMATAVPFEPGVVFDGRSIVLGVAGLIGGPVAALIASAMAVAYRLHLGGPGALMGVSVIMQSAAIGVGIRHLRARFPSVTRPLCLWLFGLLIHLIMLALALTLPPDIRFGVMREIALPVLLIYPLAFVLVSRVMLDQEASVANARALRDSEALLRAIIEQTDHGVALLRRDGSFAVYNEAMARLTGVTREDLECDDARGANAFRPLIADERRLLAAPMAEHVSYREIEVADESGGVRTFSIASSCITIGDERLRLLLVADITERKRAEKELTLHRDHLESLVEERTKELLDSKRELEAASSAKSRFLANMSHELRTPLNSIIGFSNVLSRELPGPLNPEQRRQIDMIGSSGAHLLALINDILDIAKIEAGGADVRETSFDARQLLQEVSLTVAPLASAKNLEIRIEAPPGDTALVTDQGRVRQILLNLAENAVKFTAEGHITLRYSVDAEGHAFSVSDTGQGIPAEQFDLIFDVFVQLEQPDVAKSRGTGLGLPICRQLARLLDGEITVSSEVGQGSTFTLALPHRPHVSAR